MKNIELTQGKRAIVDNDMFNYLNQFKWYTAKSYDGNLFYAQKKVRVKGKQRTTRMHNVICGTPLYKKQTDHINGNSLDNRRKNLRIVTCRENSSNQKRKREGKTSSRYVGVYLHKPTNRWVPRIKFKGKYICLGYSKDEKTASEAYQTALRNLGANG